MTYGQYAHEYRKKGYSPIPLPPKRKKPVPDGWTGREGLFASGADIQEWIDNGKADGNIAIRLPDGVIGIDVDDYDMKTGGDSMRKAVELFGRPGSSGRLTSRYDEDRVSGIRLFRVPPGTVLAAQFSSAGLGPDVEIIQFHHRYALAPGSIHPDTGHRYEWIEADGSTIGQLPAIGDLPELPEVWIEGLQPQRAETRTDVEHAAYDAMDEATQNKVAAYMERALAGVYGDLDAMKTWADGYRDDKGHGWEEGVLQKTLRLAQWVKADWNTLSTDAVLRDLKKHVPSSPDFPVSQSLGKFVRALNNERIAPMTYPLKDDIDLMAGLENRSTGKDPGADAPLRRDDVEVRAVGKTQFAIVFDTDGCRREEHKDNGAVVLKEVLPLSTAKRLMESWPIAKQPLTKAQNWWTYRDGVWALNDSVVRLSLAASFGNAYKTADVAPVEDVLSTMADEIEVEPHPDFINLRNGMLEWRTGELHDHSPDYHSTVQIPHRWDPEAECPMFDTWLTERLPGVGIQLAWELIAASLYSGLINQRAGLLYGVGNSGKSTYLEVVQGIVGRRNCSALSPQDMTKTVFATHSLLGKQTNIVTDIDPTKIAETAIFKRVVTGETIQAQQKNKPEFTFSPFCNHLFSANQIPRSSDRTSAWTRRFAILRFEHAFGPGTRILENYKQILLAEAEGIIAKAVRVLPELKWAGDFSVIIDDQEEFEAATDFTKEFWEDVVDITGNHKDFAATVQLAQAFDMWCNQHRIRNSPPFADVELRLRDDERLKRTRKRPAGAARTAAALRGWSGLTIRPEYRTIVTGQHQESADGFFDDLGGVPPGDD